jgi:serine/threonine-protein kinase
MSDELPDPLDAALRKLGEDLRGGSLGAALRCGPFTLLQLVGEGGVGEVFAATRDGEADGIVRYAVKLMRPGVDGNEALARFTRERTILDMVSHPSIPRVVASGVTAEGRLWLATDYVHGGAITDMCDLVSASLAARIELLAGVCDAVGAAHAAGVIHRDLKPSNILAAPVAQGELGGAPLFPWIIDFGIARALSGGGARLTPMGVAHRVGTPDYMSPEHWEDGIGGCDARSDVFALGVVIGEVLGGALPRATRAGSSDSSRTRKRPGAAVVPSVAFRTVMAEDAELAAKIARARGLRSADALLAALERSVDGVVAKSLAGQPNDRYADANALARALLAIMS